MQHPNDAKLNRRWRRTPLTLPEADGGLRWTRLSLAEAWDCSERKVDRLRKSGVLGDPIGKIGRTELYSNAQKQAAERAGLAGHQAAEADSMNKTRATAVGGGSVGGAGKQRSKVIAA
jgi:hypothetical protein